MPSLIVKVEFALFAMLYPAPGIIADVSSESGPKIGIAKTSPSVTFAVPRPCIARASLPVLVHS